MDRIGHTTLTCIALLAVASVGVAQAGAGDRKPLNGYSFTTIDSPSAGDPALSTAEAIVVRGRVSIPEGVDRRAMIRKSVRKDAAMPATTDFEVGQIHLVVELIAVPPKGANDSPRGLICFQDVLEPDRD